MRKVKQTSFQQIFEFYNSKKEPDINDCNDNNAPLFQDYNGRLLIHDCNLNALKNLLNKGYAGKVDLVYIDPPFGIGKRFENKKSGMAFDDKIVGSEYLQFMYERLILLRELLSDEGSIYLHCDWHKSHHLRFLLDEVFGEENFVNEVIWHYNSGGVGYECFAKKHDTILFYSKKKDFYFNQPRIKSYIPTLKGRKFAIETLNAKIDTEACSHCGKKGGFYHMTACRDVWSDINALHRNNIERLGYPTQKPEALLERIVKASSNEGSIVLDCFMGSGTTQAVAQKLGRKWIGIDCNKDSIETVKKRFLKKFNISL
jgi:adenine specific DNA methylase Mod